MNFGEALEALKSGKAISREGWNGKNMFIFLNKGSLAANHAAVDLTDDGINITGPIEGLSSMLFDVRDFGTTVRLPNLNMRAATGSTVTGWLASQTDLLAEDWGVVQPQQ